MRWSLFDADAQHVLLDARRRARGTGDGTISSEHVLAACLVDPLVVEVLTMVGIDHHNASDRLGLPSPPNRSELLGHIGIDGVAVGDRLADASSVPWRLRRWATRPLCIMLEAPSSRVRFAGRSRKVLEVAVWNAKRHRRASSSLDLFRGVLTDGRDPVNECLLQDECAARRLLMVLHQLDNRAA